MSKRKRRKKKDFRCEQLKQLKSCGPGFPAQEMSLLWCLPVAAYRATAGREGIDVPPTDRCLCVWNGLQWNVKKIKNKKINKKERKIIWLFVQLPQFGAPPPTILSSFHFNIFCFPFHWCVIYSPRYVCACLCVHPIGCESDNTLIWIWLICVCVYLLCVCVFPAPLLSGCIAALASAWRVLESCCVSVL